MIPLILAAVGFLAGAASTYVFTQKDIEATRIQIQNMEKMQRVLEDQMKRATQRETKHRLERFHLVLGWTSARLDLLLENKEVSLERLQRLWATSKALGQMRGIMPPNGVLPDSDQAFLEIIVRAQSGEKLSRVDAAVMDDYLANKVPEAMREFLEERMSSLYRHHQHRLAHLQHEQLEQSRELRVMRLRREVESLATVGIYQVESRLKKVSSDISECQITIDEIKRNLVIITRLSRPRQQWDEYDDIAGKLLERIVRKEVLGEADWSFLTAYRDTYFLSARDMLKKNRGIDLAGVEEFS